MVHPNSGAGRIKEDGHDAEATYEVKDARRSFTLSGKELETSWVRATREGKEARWIILFTDLGIEAEITVRKRATP